MAHHAYENMYFNHTHTDTYIDIELYSASQIKRNREVSMFYHNLIKTIINE